MTQLPAEYPDPSQLNWQKQPSGCDSNVAARVCMRPADSFKVAGRLEGLLGSGMPCNVPEVGAPVHLQFCTNKRWLTGVLPQ